jgi:hypothetical protein
MARVQPTMPAQPAGVTLRPLGIGDVIDRVFGIYRARAIGLFVLGIILFVAVVVTWLAVTVAFALAGASTFQRVATQRGSDLTALLMSPAFAEFVGGLIIYGVIAWLLMLLVGAIFTGAVIDAAAAAHLGQDRSLAKSFIVGFQSSIRIFLAGLLASVAGTFVGVVYNVAAELNNNLLFQIVLLIAYLFAIVYIEASWFVSPVVATIERHGPISSLRRSWTLSTGFRWRIVGLFILLVVLAIVLVVLTLFVIGALTAIDRNVGAVATFIALFVAVPLWMPLFFGTMTVLYYDLRVRKEGLDLQLAAEAMPRA